MARIQVIVNPAAGAGKTAKKWPRIKAVMEDMGLDFEYALTEAPGHAMELTKSAVNKGCEMVVSVGGDGTIHEIANGLYAAGANKRVVVGIVNTGTGADYIRTIGVPRAYKEACQRLTSSERYTVDLGVVEYMTNGSTAKRVFVNFAGLGFDAEVVKATTVKFKSLGAMASYLMGLLSTLMSYENRSISIVVDGEVMERKVCTVMMNHGKYGGGGMFAAPNADPGDGLFDVLIIDDMTKLDLLASLPRIYRGTHLTHPKVSMKKAKEVEIRTVLSTAVQADGELLGEAPARFTVLPAALTIVI